LPLVEAPDNNRSATSAPAPLLPHLAARGWRIEDVASPSGAVWETANADAPVDYPETGHELLAAIEDDGVWHGERNRLIAAALAEHGLPGHLVEVGAGNGVVAAHLRTLGIGAVAIEPARRAAEVAALRGVPTVCGMLEDLRLPDGSVEAVGLFDVLEHLAEPASLLAEVHRVLARGGRLAITVPAMPALWSRADELAGHHRRYRRRELIDALAAAGFTARSCRYAFGALVPAVGLLRAVPDRLGRLRSDEQEAEAGTRQVAGYGEFGRTVARSAFSVERAVRRTVNVPIGTSLVGVFGRGL
jgi:SAM-dependent methyltransferase